MECERRHTHEHELHNLRMREAVRLRSRLQLLMSTTYDVVETLVANHRRFLSFIEKRVGSREAAEDILQDAFMRGLDSASLREAESAVAWFYRALHNAIVDHYRRRGAESRAIEQFASEPRRDDELMETVCACLRNLVSTLKPEYADAITRVDLEGVKPAKYAEESNISANTARVRLFRAREALRRRVEQSCGTCADHGCLDCSCR